MLVQFISAPFIAALAAVTMLSSVAHAQDGAHSVITDHTKTVIFKTPEKVEVCYNEQVPGDKTGDTLKGAIIGGIIGNNVTKNVDNGGAVGALIGGIIGHNHSDAKGGTKRVCRTETRYTESTQVVYSHSTITFWYEGRQYTAKFVK